MWRISPTPLIPVYVYVYIGSEGKLKAKRFDLLAQLVLIMPIYRHCEECKEFYPARRYRVIQGTARFCSLKCKNTWIAREVTPLRDQSGSNNPNWKGGISKDNYRYKKRQVKKYPKRARARSIVAKAKRTGKLIPKPCLVCGASQDIQAHHEDYNKPLEVIWLCRSCHRDLHEARKHKRAA